MMVRICLKLFFIKQTISKEGKKINLPILIHFFFKMSGLF